MSRHRDLVNLAGCLGALVLAGVFWWGVLIAWRALWVWSAGSIIIWVFVGAIWLVAIARHVLKTDRDRIVAIGESGLKVDSE